MKKECLIIVDAQNDFGNPEGTLYVKDWETIVPCINNLIQEFKSQSKLIISTQDWHPDNHISFASTHNVAPYSQLDWDTKWPDHCVAGSWWADYIDWLDSNKIDKKVYKWYEKDIDSYSWFWARELQENWKTLDEILQENQIKVINIVWLATEFCDKATVMDAIDKWYEVVLHTKWIKAVNINPIDWDDAIRQMQEKWAKII